MPTDHAPVATVAAAEETFRKLVLEQYDLENDFVDAICGFFRTAAAPLAESSAAAPKRARNSTAASKPRKSRRKSAYNVFVREMMKTDDIKQLDHKAKMGAIAERWKQLTDDDKQPYTTMANAENESVEESA